MERLTLPGFPKAKAETRFIDGREVGNEDIEFHKCASQLFLLNFEPGEKRPLHRHEELRVTFVRSGAGRFLIDGSEKIAEPGDMLMVMPFIDHSLEVMGDEPLILAELVLPG